MKERGIIFATDMVRAILDNHKTQTRRTWGLEWINQDPDAFEFLRMEGDLAVFHQIRLGNLITALPPLRSLPKKMEGVEPNVLFYIKCPYGQVGDWLWVKETFNIIETVVSPSPVPDKIVYKASPESYQGYLGIHWRSSRFMPRSESRIDLEITGVRAERLQQITYKDIWAEGCPTKNMTNAYFRDLWDSFNAKRGYGWNMNRWVWPISFKRI